MLDLAMHLHETHRLVVFSNPCAALETASTSGVLRHVSLVPPPHDMRSDHDTVVIRLIPDGRVNWLRACGIPVNRTNQSD